MNKSILKSVGAVFAGVLANFLIAVPLDALFHMTGVFPPMAEQMSDALFVLAFSYRVIAALAGGYLTARLAPNKPMQHALILGGVGILLCCVGAYVMGDLGPLWYSLALIAIALPCSWMGAKYYLR